MIKTSSNIPFLPPTTQYSPIPNSLEVSKVMSVADKLKQPDTLHLEQLESLILCQALADYSTVLRRRPLVFIDAELVFDGKTSACCRSQEALLVTEQQQAIQLNYQRQRASGSMNGDEFVCYGEKAIFKVLLALEADKTPDCITSEQINDLQQKMARHIEDNKDALGQQLQKLLSEYGSERLSVQNSSHGISFEQAAEVYLGNHYDRQFKCVPVRPWVEPLVLLLFGMNSTLPEALPWGKNLKDTWKENIPATFPDYVKEFAKNEKKVQEFTTSLNRSMSTWEESLAIDFTCTTLNHSREGCREAFQRTGELSNHLCHLSDSSGYTAGKKIINQLAEFFYKDFGMLRSLPRANSHMPCTEEEEQQIAENQSVFKSGLDWIYEKITTIIPSVLNTLQKKFAISNSGGIFATAAPVTLPRGAIEWDKKNNFIIVKDESTKMIIINNFKEFMINHGQLTKESADKFENDLRDKAIGTGLYISHDMASEEKEILSRQKRVNRDKYITDHIESNCAFETEILDTTGVNEGSVLIFKAQRAENPFRMIYDNRPNSSPSIDQRAIADGLNLVTDIWTVGIKPFIGNLIANSYRKEYYKNKGDKICADRQNHLNLAEIATALEIDGLAFQHRGSAPHKKPKELQHVTSFVDRAAYYSRNKHSGVQRELLFKVTNKNTIVDNGREILLRKNKNGEFVTFHPHATKPELLERRVIVDENTMIWRYADTFDTSPLNVEIHEGKNFINLYGNNYELHMNADKNYEISIQKKSGIKEFVPVYMEPLSKSWHLKTHNEKPVFNKKQLSVIDRLKITAEENKNYYAIDNLNNKYYGTGKIFEVRNRHENIQTDPALFSVIEMNGNLVPVKTKAIREHGVRYNVYDMIHQRKEYPIEWDGARWIFERNTSPHISKELKKIIKSDMYAKKVDAGQLSAPDHQGLRWSDSGKKYLKFKNEFIEIVTLNENRFLLKTENGLQNCYLRYEKNKFRIENLAERMKNIQSVGLSGGEGKTERKVVQKSVQTQSGTNADSQPQATFRITASFLEGVQREIKSHHIHNEETFLATARKYAENPDTLKLYIEENGDYTQKGRDLIDMAAGPSNRNVANHQPLLEPAKPVKIMRNFKDIDGEILKLWSQLGFARRNNVGGMYGFAQKYSISLPKFRKLANKDGTLKPAGELIVKNEIAKRNQYKTLEVSNVENMKVDAPHPVIKQEPMEPFRELEPINIRKNQLHFNNNLPILRDPSDMAKSLTLDMVVNIETIKVNDWGDLNNIFDSIRQAKEPYIIKQDKIKKIKENILVEAKEWLRTEGQHADRFDSMLDVSQPVADGPYRGDSVYAKRDIKQFEVLGPYSGTYHKDDSSLAQEMEKYGDANVLAYLWRTRSKYRNVSGYSNGNTLSLINTSQLPGIPEIWKHNNIGGIQVENNLIYYVALEDIKVGQELLVNYGADYNSNRAN